MGLSRGTTLGNFEILEFIGAGGMGEVYRVRDRKLGREVAIKVLPEDFAQNSQRLTRFEREARTLASLKHENIGHLYDFQVEGDVHYLVLELIDGETLADRIDRGPLSLEETLPLFIQIAEALEAAHVKGIIHRDLKPANIKITPEGKVKLLDFGMAKSVENYLPVFRTDATEVSGTDPTKVTMDGTILGTPSYMSPEQAKGQKVDQRTDIWAFGCCLYEVLTGRTPFGAETAMESLARVLEREADWKALPAETPANIQAVLKRCLEKDFEKRVTDMSEIRIEFEDTVFQLRRSKVKSSLLEPIADYQETPKDVIAVLPFEDLSDDAGHEWFVDGMTEALINELARIKSLRVISRTSIMQFKGTGTALPKIAQELGVNAVVEGSVVRANEEVRIDAQLIHAQTDQHLWAGSYSGSMTNVLSMQSELALAISKEIKIVLTPEEVSSLARSRPVNSAAYDAYLKGRFFWNRRTKEGLRTAISEFERSKELETGFALPYVGLADSYHMLGTWEYLSPEESFLRAELEAMRALRIDDTLAEPHISLAYAMMSFDWEWKVAEDEFRLGLELNPSYVTGYHWYATFLAWMGRFDEALIHIEYAQDLDPLSLIVRSTIGLVRYLEKRYEDATARLEDTLKWDPNFLPALDFLSLSYQSTSKFEEAIEVERSIVKIRGGDASSMVRLASACAAAGAVGEARGMLEEVLIRSTSEYVSPESIAQLYLNLNETDKAFDWLSKAFERKDWRLAVLKVNPRWDPVRSDQRFCDLLEKMKFPQSKEYPDV